MAEKGAQTGQQEDSPEGTGRGLVLGDLYVHSCSGVPRSEGGYRRYERNQAGVRTPSHSASACKSNRNVKEVHDYISLSLFPVVP